MPKFTPAPLTTAALLQAAAERVGRDAEQLTLRELTTPAGRERWAGRTRDAAYSYPPSPGGKLGGGSPEWRGERYPATGNANQFGGRSLPPPGTLQNPFPPLGANETVEAVMPFKYGEGGERERDRRAAQRDLGAHLRGPSFGSGLRDRSGFVQPVEPAGPDRGQGVGYPPDRDLDDFVADDLDLSDQHNAPEDEPIGLLPAEHRGEARDYYLAHDAGTGTIGIFRHGRDQPVARFRPPPGTGVADCRIARDRRSGRIAIMRRRNRDRMLRLQHEAADIARRPTRDSLGQERQMLATQNDINREFWARPTSSSDFWNRRR
jgi:hypothetical protein